ncbi:MAG: GNAT family N-acetyltransferase [Chloroflexota bacterium]|nr:MAG: GNAT family N-acetyltransferase [Chloroflexota bacterium]
MAKHEVEIEPGLKYTEETGRLLRSLPVRDCFLWKEGFDEPVSGLNLVSFGQRIGALPLPSEGIGGVETLPEFRQQGYMTTLMKKALKGVARRVKIAFVSDAIEEMYEKFGFVNCLAEAYLSIPGRHVELISAGSEPVSSSIRSFLADDLPAMVNLYNEEHTHRSWTHERDDGWNRLLQTQTWRPGSKVIVLERDESLAGYAILTEQSFGHAVSSFVVDELTARDIKAARALLAEIASRCWQLRISEFRVREPLDSTVGRAARELGCEYRQTFPISGGMMGAILDRPGLLQVLEPELRRRLRLAELSTDQATAFAGLRQGEIVPDNQALLRLLLGYWSLDDALAFGTTIPARYEPVFAAMFPGGGTKELPLPYSHILDRY